MATSTTIIAALKYESGVVMAADSQASDPNAQVRWPIEKLRKLKNYPLVAGFSGNTGVADRAWSNLEGSKTHANMFKKRDRIRDLLDRNYDPIYKRIKKMSPEPSAPIWKIALWGLSAFWADDNPHILEHEINGDCCFHEYFHAIGSGAATAYAIWRTLGGRELAQIDESKCIMATLRILRTCVDVEVWGVSEPLGVWIVSNGQARELPPDQIEAHKQYVGEWEERERKTFFGI